MSSGIAANPVAGTPVRSGLQMENFDITDNICLIQDLVLLKKSMNTSRAEVCTLHSQIVKLIIESFLYLQY